MNVGSALKSAKKIIDSLDAEVIFLEVLKEQDRSYLAAHEDRVLTEAEEMTIKWMTKRREQGEPLAYIIGRKEFYGRNFRVNTNVLIPRPDSENIIDIVKKLDCEKIIDVGTGSGCLAITLALEKPNARVTGVDISKKALFVAAENMIELGAKVNFFESDLLDGVGEEKFDVIVANLPYVDISWPWKSKELDWEPGLALYAGDRGLEIVKKMIRQAENRTKYLVLEVDTCQHDEVKKYAAKYNFRHIETQGFILLFSKD